MLGTNDSLLNSVMKAIDNEVLNELEKVNINNLQLFYPRGNAKSGMDCIRLTGKNPYAEQEEQKKMKVRK